MIRQTADISNLCKYKWFQWVMHYQPPQSYLEDKIEIGQYLGPTVDVSNAMTYKILKANGEVVHQSTIQPWTLEEEACPEFAVAKKSFMTKAHETPGTATQVLDFEDVLLTPDFEYYDGKEEDGFGGSPNKILPPTPSFSDNYVGANLMLSHGSEYSKGRVIKRA